MKRKRKSFISWDRIDWSRKRWTYRDGSDVRGHRFKVVKRRSVGAQDDVENGKETAQDDGQAAASGAQHHVLFAARIAVIRSCCVERIQKTEKRKDRPNRKWVGWNRTIYSQPTTKAMAERINRKEKPSQVISHSLPYWGRKDNALRLVIAGQRWDNVKVETRKNH